MEPIAVYILSGAAIVLGLLAIVLVTGGMNDR
jgi:hypothetical protein